MGLREYKIINSKSRLPVIITAPHAQAPNADKYTGALAEMLGKQTGATVIIGKISRLYLDLNRQEANKHPFRKRLRKLVLEKKRPLLILDIHGEKDDKVELGTANGLTADPQILNMIKDALKAYNLYVVVDEHLNGSQAGTIIRSFGRPKDGIHAIQIELPPSLRTPKSLGFTLSVLASVIKNFCSNTQR
jgi:N-formylglutamate amidohydrolase